MPKLLLKCCGPIDTAQFREMPQPHSPDPPKQVAPSPICHACGKVMRLVAAEPSSRFVNLDNCTFRCECGKEGNYILAREE
jgi:hypothetical protein